MKKQFAIILIGVMLLSAMMVIPVMSDKGDKSDLTTSGSEQIPYSPITALDETPTLRTISTVCADLQQYLDCTSTKKADIVFVFDTTGSMGGEIAEMKNIAKDFADDLTTSGIDYRLGLTDFKDFPGSCEGITCGDSGDFAYKIYNGGVLTDSASIFKSWIDLLSAAGGEDGPESTLAALWHTANDQKWNGGDVSKIAILISDASPHTDGHCCNQEGNTFNGVISELTKKGIKVYVVGPNTDSMTNIASETGGIFYLIRSDVTLEPILNEITGMIKCSFDIMHEASCENDVLKVCVQLRGKDNVLIPYQHGDTSAWMIVACADGTSHKEGLTYDEKTKKYCAVVDPVCDGKAGDVEVTVYGSVCDWTAVDMFKVSCGAPCGRCLTVNVTINANHYAIGDTLDYEVSVTNNQDEKSRIAITYGYIDSTPKTHNIGTYMPDIYPGDTYAFSADFKLLDDFYSGKYVFFATAIDMQDPNCAESDAEIFWV